MQRTLIHDGQDHERVNRRAARTRSRIRIMIFALFTMCLIAIAQERSLAPPVHDGMVKLSGLTLDYVNRSEKLSAALEKLQKSYDELVSDG